MRGMVADSPDMSASPLAQTHFDMIRAAVTRSRKIRRASTVANASGWTLVLFGLPALAFGIFSIPSALVGVLLLAVSWGEFQGAKGLRRLDTRAPKRLAFNQVVLGFGLAAYGAWGIVDGLRNPSPIDDAVAQAPEVQQMLGSFQDVWTFGIVGFYGVFIAATLLTTSMTAWYYASRRQALRAHLTSTPQWVIDVQRAAA